MTHHALRPSRAHPSPAPLLRIVYSDSGRGLHQDADFLESLFVSRGWGVVREVLEPWTIKQTQRSHRVAGLKNRLPPIVRRLWNRLQVAAGRPGKIRVDLQIHLESLSLNYLAAARVNWLLPNQEWMRTQHLSFLPYIDRVLCKTEHAQRLFEPLHEQAIFSGFSSRLAAQRPLFSHDPERYRRFLHVAGKNRKKGTRALVEAWRRQPGWPRLELVADSQLDIGPIPDNVRLWHNVSDARLHELRSECGIVIAPSEVEGFGHVLLEGMLYDAVVVTTDAPPMNELILKEHGVLLPWTQQQPCHLGTRYHVEADAIEQAVAGLLAMRRRDLAHMGRMAGLWAEANHVGFIDRLSMLIEPFASPASDSALQTISNRPPRSSATAPSNNEESSAAHKRPSVSVIMPTHNCLAYLPHAVQSALDQGIDDMEIIVFDDGSSDGTAEWLRQTAQREPRIVDIYGSGIGPAAARNRCLHYARGEYVAFLDADDRWRPGKLVEQLRFLREHPTVVLSFTDFQLVNEQGEPGTTGYAFWARFSKVAARTSGYRLLDKALPRLFIENPVGTSSVVARRDALQRANGFDPLLPSAEDWDLWLNLAAFGEVAFSEAITVDYLVRAGSESSRMADRLQALDMIFKRHQHKVIKVGSRVPLLARSRLAAATAQYLRERKDYGQALAQHLKSLALNPSRNGLKAVLVDLLSCMPFNRKKTEMGAKS
jgi:glycosyltransferase involved in cell wall biosynthesis